MCPQMGGTTLADNDDEWQLVSLVPAGITCIFSKLTKLQSSSGLDFLPLHIIFLNSIVSCFTYPNLFSVQFVDFQYR